MVPMYFDDKYDADRKKDRCSNSELTVTEVSVTLADDGTVTGEVKGEVK